MATGQKPVVDYSLCMACTACVPACPFGCLAMERLGVDRYRKAYPELVKPDACTGCGLCARACPVDCIELK